MDFGMVETRGLRRSPDRPSRSQRFFSLRGVTPSFLGKFTACNARARVHSVGGICRSIIMGGASPTFKYC